MEVVGTPSPEVLAKISSEHVSHQLPLVTKPTPNPSIWRKGSVIGPRSLWGAQATMEWAAPDPLGMNGETFCA